jgi:tetratricopeptide (TPR) repeat protein/TolB-like protein
MAALQATLQHALGSTYRIERELGGGGMSHVFLAEETALGRKVVIKLLPPEAASGVSEERFRREVQLAAQLQHPNVVPLLAAGAAGGLLYFVMPFIEGESLRARLARETELPLGEAVQLLREICDALAFAHERGIVHRDIKPDNVMLSHGHAVVTDFGVAKALDRARGGASATGDGTGGASTPAPSAEALTPYGIALGTPAYMAPEQAAGDANVDHRADIYALGILAYEMIAGATPFQGKTAQALISAHFVDIPVPLATERPTVPPALEALVMRCLEKRPADRWQQAREMVPRLDEIAAELRTGASTSGRVPAGAVGAAPSTARVWSPTTIGALFIVAALALLAAVWGIVTLAGLPDWVVVGAAVLLAIGFPVMTLTARREQARSVASAAGLAVPSAGAQGMFGRLLSWRGALTGGGLAFGGLAAVTAAFLALRALGVGGFATLLSAGVLGANDVVVVADFTNRTTDSTLGASVTEAIRVDLAQSSVLRLVEHSRTAAALERMQRPTSTPLTEGVAREVAEREGARAVISGEVGTLGSGYVLTARVVSVADSSTLLSVRETADGPGGIIGAVERLSRKLREGVGESLRTIRRSPALEQVTTASLPALRAFSEGSRLMVEGNRIEALRHLENAVLLDSTFGMAWRKLAVLLGNMGGDQARRLDAATRAYNLRDRMPAYEAAHAAAYYQFAVVGDLARAIQEYERLVATWPDDFIANGNLGVLLGRIGRPEESLTYFQRTVAIEPGHANSNANLLSALVNLGRMDEAKVALEKWATHQTAVARRLEASGRLARERWEFSAALAIADSLTALDTPDALTAAFDLRATTLRMMGRYREAARVSEQTAVYNARLGQRGAALSDLLDIVAAEILVLDRRDEALRAMDAALARFPLASFAPASRPYGLLIGNFAVVGRVDRARALKAEMEREVPREALARDAWAVFGTALLELESGGDARRALEDIRRAQRMFACRACTLLHEGMALERLAEPDSALATYERLAAITSIFPDARDLLLFGALRRAGEMHDARGNRARALEYYGRAIDLWKDADAELQPIVAQLRRRTVELAGERE